MIDMHVGQTSQDKLAGIQEVTADEPYCMYILARRRYILSTPQIDPKGWP